MAEKRSHYRELEVDPEASDEVVKAAYKALAQIHHADTGRSTDGTRMTRVNVAYGVIRDPSKRAFYDAELAEEPTARNDSPARRGASDSGGQAGSRKSRAAGGPVCPKCGKAFQTAGGFKWHQENYPNCRRRT